MRVCPRCGFIEAPCWKRSFQGNPNGDIDVARLDMLEEYEPNVAIVIKDVRGKPVTIEPFTYYLGKRAIWVKRVWSKLFKEGGMSVFNVPHESGRKRK